MKKPKELKIKKCPFGCDEDVKLVKVKSKSLYLMEKSIKEK